MKERVSLGAVGLVMMLIMGVRWREWRQEVGQFEAGRIWRIRVQLQQPIRINEYGGLVEWRGWTIYLFKRDCEISNIAQMSAGDILDLEIKIKGTNYPYSMQATKVMAEKNNRLKPMSLVWWQRQLWRVRKGAVSILDRLLPRRESSLVAGVVFGVKETLGSDFKAALIQTGTMHVVAASGYNISVVSGIALKFLLNCFKRKWAAVFALMFVWGYVLLAGADPPVVRAGMMGSLLLLSWITGRELWVVFGYLMCGGIMLIWAPWLLKSVSFQLSMAATAGIIWGSAYLGNYLKPMTTYLNRGWLTGLIWQNFVSTIAATGAIWPLLLLHFGTVSLWGLVVNPVVLGFVPLIMYLGIGMCVFGSIWLPAGQLLAWLAAPLVQLWTETIMWAGSLGGAQIVSVGSWWWVGGWWLIWLGLILIASKK